MAYIRKVLAKDEKMIGIARLHWIYVFKGLFWFLVLAGAGWFLDAAVSKAVLAISASTGAKFIPAALMTVSNGAMYFMMVGGFMIFFLFVLKVLVTEVGLTSRRVIEKTGLIFVKVRQVDIEEIRGENLDLGHLGRVLGYGYVFLDCRFIGDVRLPAIENPERFLRALHQARTKSQDSLSLVVGKGNATPVDMNQVQAQPQPELPQPAAPTQPPEIQPGQPAGPQPEVNPPQYPEQPVQPVPHSPPPAQQPPSQPEQPPAQPPEPIPAPPPSEPPLQPPSGQTQDGDFAQGIKNRMQDMGREIAEGSAHLSQSIPSATSQQQPPQQSAFRQKAQQLGQSGPAQDQPMDAQMVADVVKQIMPQMAQQVAKELVNQGVIGAPEEEHPNKDLITSFDEAAIENDGNAGKKRLAHAVH